MTEALSVEAAAVRRLHRAAARRRSTDGQAGLRVVRILEAATQSLARARPRHRARGSKVHRMIPFRRSEGAVPVASSPRSTPRSRACSTARSSSSARRSRRSSRSSPPTAAPSTRIARQHRHERAAPGAARGRRRPGRRGDHRAVHLRRHGRRRSATPARRRCSSTSSRDSFTMDPAQLEAAITPRTKAILPCISTASRPTWTRSSTIAEPPRPAGDRGRLPGARRRVQGPPRRAASATSGCFSFYPGQEPRRLRRRRHGRHQRRRRCAKTIRMLRDWGEEKKYHHVLKGFNYRMDGIQGAILRVKLRHLDAVDRGAPRARRRRTGRCSPDSGVAAPQRGAGRAGTSITSTRCAPPTATALQRDAAGRRRRRPAALSDSGAPAAGARDLGYKAGDFPQSERGGQRSAVAADVPGADARAGRAGCAPRCEQEAYVALTRQRARIVTAVHGRARRLADDPAFERGSSAQLRGAVHARRAARALRAVRMHGDGALDALMRRVIWRALARRAGHGLQVGSGVGFKHLETFEIGDGVFIGAQALHPGPLRRHAA